jgi:tetratricopeptide (TPR) repeat protein
MQLRKGVGDRAGIASSMTDLGNLAQARGDLALAREHWEDGLSEAEQIGAAPLQVVLLTRLGEAALILGKVADARKSIERAAALAADIEDRRSYVDILRNLALVELREGNGQLAKQYCKECLELAESSRMRAMVARAQMAMGEAHAATLFDEGGGGPGGGAAESHFRKAINLFRRLGNDAELARALRRFGEFLVERGEVAAGRKALEEAAGIGEHLELRHFDEVRRTLAELG